MHQHLRDLEWKFNQLKDKFAELGINPVNSR
jgi:hypothetical protein